MFKDSEKDNCCHTRLRHNRPMHKIRPCSDAFIPQPQATQQNLKNLSLSQAELNKFDDIISKFDRIPPRNCRTQLHNTINRKSSTLNRYRKSNNQNEAMEEASTMLVSTNKSKSQNLYFTNHIVNKNNNHNHDETKESFQEINIKAICKDHAVVDNAKCCTSCRQQQHHPSQQHFYTNSMKKHSRPAHPVVAGNSNLAKSVQKTPPMEESSNGIRELLNSCQLHASSCGNLSNGSGVTNSASPINLTTNPIDSTICCTQPRATIVVQQVFF